MRFRTLFQLMAAIGIFVGCRAELEFQEGPFPGGNPDINNSGGDIHMVFSSSSGSASITLDASKKWTASFVNERAKDWCSLSTEDGKRGTATITVSVTENPDYDERSASINFVCDDVKRTIIVTQKQKDALLVSGSRFDVGKEGGHISVEVKSSVSFDIMVSEDSKDWIKQIGTKAMSSSTLTFAIAENDSFQKREGAISFVSATGTETVRVYQGCDTPTIILSSGNYVLDAGPGQFSVEVQSNIDVSYGIIQGGGWIREVTTKSMSTSTFCFAVDENQSRSVRYGGIAFRSDDRSCADTVFVTQAFHPILTSGSTFLVSGRGWTVCFDTVGPDPSEYRIEPEDEWLSLISQENVSGISRFTVDVQGNDGSEAREGRIQVYFKAYSEPDTVIVRQHVRLPAFSYTTSSRNVRIPKVEGEAGDGFGFVFWGDGANELYDENLSHVYGTSGVHTVTVEVGNKKRVSFTGLEDGMTINFRELRNK